MMTRSAPEMTGWSMDLKRKAAYYVLCAAMEDKAPACAEQGPAWDEMDNREKAGLCSSCPLRKPCQAYAETDPINTWGVWGGQLYPRTKRGQVSHLDPEERMVQ